MIDARSDVILCVVVDTRNSLSMMLTDTIILWLLPSSPS